MLQVLSALLWSVASTAPDAHGANPPRVLVYTVSAGYEHEVVRRAAPDELSIVERALVDLGSRSGAFQAVVSREAAAFEAASLAQFQAVLFYTTGELPLSAAQRAGLFEFVRSGGGFVGVHSATDTFYTVPEYGAMIGATFDGHPWHERVSIAVEDPTHIATQHLGERFDFVDEIYQFKAPYSRAGVHVLLSLAPDGLDVAREPVHRQDRDFALAWTRPFGDGRVFYSALGHRPEVWKDARFLTHLAGGIRWALGDEPQVKLSPEDDARRSFALAESGNPRAGFGVFKRESGPMCGRCHVVNGTGTEVGPDLSSVALRLTQSELLTAILAPSAAITHGYGAVTLDMKDGTQIFGRVTNESETALTLIDTTGTARSIAREAVLARLASKISAMPDGLAATLTNEEFRDLFAYVRTLKAPPPTAVEPK
ncbi:MAG: ThuA domain-containing protein [Planctomycetes bacterium]|nr:ThuA domain-containing protein [Planctomycetota bacterium]